MKLRILCLLDCMDELLDILFSVLFKMLMKMFMRINKIVIMYKKKNMGLRIWFEFVKELKLKFFNVMDIMFFKVFGNDVQFLLLILNIINVNCEKVKNSMKNNSMNDDRGLLVSLMVIIRVEMCWLNFNRWRNFNIEKNIVMVVVVDIYLFKNVMY